VAIELITGLPGNAKTLHALELVIKRSTAENRPVFYAGLKEFQEGDPRLNGISWQEFDPLTWHENVPSGAICLIDESQKFFRSRSLGSVPPKYVTELEEHRHKGLDFYMITQHPSFVDPAVRKLTQAHRHMMRIFGMEASTVHFWPTGVKENCEKAGSRSDSEKSKWGFNKGLYGLYKSADVHTMKRRIPGRVKMLGVILLLLAAAIYYMVGFIGKKTGVVQNPTVSASAAGTPGLPPQSGIQPAGTVQKVFDPLEDAKHFVQMETPRVAGLTHTAPKYDEITKPTRAPVPAACIQIGSAASGKTPRCKCYSQSGTPMNIEFDMCINIAQNGYFLDFDPEQGRAAAAKAENGRAVLSNRPDSPAPVRADVPTVVAFAPVPDSVPHVAGIGGSPK
jgi:zona occludens toxin